jgi:hypothetical protein
VATTSPTQAQLADAKLSRRVSFSDRRKTHRFRWSEWIALWHLTSLDAPTVAVVWTLGFATAAGVRLPFWVPLVLALCGWSVYIGDRLLDAYRAMRSFRLSHMQSDIEGLRPRHYFHWKHRRVLLPLAIASAMIAVALVAYYMPLPARERNSVLAVAALAYFTSVHSPWRISPRRLQIPKELLVGILFTLACALPIWSRVSASEGQRLALLPSTLAFIALAWLNCEAIEAWESAPHRNRIFYCAIALCATTALASARTAGMHEPLMAGLLASAAFAAGLLALLDRRAARLAPTTLRAAADLALLTPVLLIFVALIS